MSKKKNYQFSYLKSGVNVKLGNDLVKEIKPFSKKTLNNRVIGGIGGFGAVYNLDVNKYKKPYLVSATDGVGTKILIARELKNYKTIGIDLVAMSVNDIIVQGAKPLFFLDYIAVEKIKKNQILDIIKGISKGCIESDCSLVGGETAELPGLYNDSKFDLAGFCVGIVEKKNLLPKKGVKPGNLLLGLPSNGIHSNGYSLIRNIFLKKQISYNKKFYNNKSYGDVLLKPTKIYVKPILKILDHVNVNALCHITGGGISENLKRVIPKKLGASIKLSKLDFNNKRSIFYWLGNNCNLSIKEMLSTFNCGIGMIIIIRQKDLDKTIGLCKEIHQPVKLLGKIIDNEKFIFN